MTDLLPCPFCDGGDIYTGPDGSRRCWRCHGRGVVLACPECDGMGVLVDEGVYECPHCDGTGIKPEDNEP